jgi:hypothetical protein
MTSPTTARYVKRQMRVFVDGLQAIEEAELERCRKGEITREEPWLNRISNRCGLNSWSIECQLERLTHVVKNIDLLSAYCLSAPDVLDCTHKIVILPKDDEDPYSVVGSDLAALTETATSDLKMDRVLLCTSGNGCILRSSFRSFRSRIIGISLLDGKYKKIERRSTLCGDPPFDLASASELDHIKNRVKSLLPMRKRFSFI